MTNGKNITDLFADLIEHLSTLFRKEIQLAKVEAGEKVQQVTNGAIFIGIGGAVLLAALILLLHAAVAWLTVLGLEIEWSTTIVAVVTGVVGLVLLFKGISNLRATNLAPKRTVAQIQRDITTVREQVR